MAVVDGTDCPADEIPRVEVEDRRQVEPSAPSNDELGRIADPPLVRGGSDEVLSEEVGSDRLVMIAHRRAFDALPHAGLQPLGLLQSNHAFPAHPVPLLAQVAVDAGTTIRTATRLMGGTNQHPELPVLLRTRRGRSPRPRIEPAAGHLEHLTEVRNRHRGLLRLDERESYSLSFAKKAAAFFRTSRSTRNRRFSFRSRRNSSRSSLVNPVRPFVRSARARSIPGAQRRLGQIEVAGDPTDRLAFVEHEPHRTRFVLVVKLPAWPPGLRRLDLRGHRNRLSEGVLDTGSSPHPLETNSVKRTVTHPLRHDARSA